MTVKQETLHLAAMSAAETLSTLLDDLQDALIEQEIEDSMFRDDCNKYFDMMNRADEIIVELNDMREG